MSDFSQSNSLFNKPPKTKAEYSRNIKKLKLKLANIEEQIEVVQKKMRAFTNTSNDKMIALKISKFCKQRRMTPQMLFRCADRLKKGSITKAAFKDTLLGLGIKLSQHEMTRLEYLLDEDVSGEISSQEYNAFLNAFRIKGEFAPEDVFLQDILKKLDIGKIKDDDTDPTKKKKQLLNYEQFLKFCHRHMSNLKDKQIAAIFNILQKNNLIDLDQFMQYIRKKDEERRKLQQRNKKHIIKKDTITDQSTLKGIIKLILKNRPKESKQLFHCLQFTKIERILGKNKGQLLQLFKQIDKQKKGSFSFGQLIQFYIDKQRDRDLMYVYELMGRKMYLEKEKPEDVIYRYNGGIGNKRISIQDFKKFMQKEFGVIESDAEAVYRALEKKQNQVLVKTIIDAMKLDQGQKKMVYIKPTMWKTFGKDFWRKGSMTILFNPFVALRFCIYMAEQLKKQEQTYWDDFQFGPTMEDPYGAESIGLDNFSDSSVKWLTVQSLGMKQFYTDFPVEQYEASNNCPHEMVPKTITQLIKSNELQLWSTEKVDYNVKKVEPENLRHLFDGLYPIIFHSFSACGIYVFRFYSREKWAYVIIDNKIPCNSENEPLFSRSKVKNQSWVSLIEKAYAKLKGNYRKMFNVNSQTQYIHELNRKLPIIFEIPKALASAEQKNQIWQRLIALWQQKRKEGKLYASVSDSESHQLLQNKVETGFKTNFLNQILSLLEIKDQGTQNAHKSHRLILVKGETKNQKAWNPNWNGGEDTNKFDKFYSQIESDLKKNEINASILKFKNINVINYKLFRSIFTDIFNLKNCSFEQMVILRKTVEFQEKHVCRYELNSKLKDKKPLKMIVTLNKVRGPDDTAIELALKDAKNAQITKTQSKRFGAFQFTISPDLQYLELKVTNWHDKQDHIYILTFYMQSTQYHLKQLDRQQLFHFVSPVDEAHYLDLAEADQKERLYIYRNYFKGAERGTGCCG